MPKVTIKTIRLMTATLVVVSLLGMALPESPIQAQTSSPLDARVYDADSGSWSSDGRYFVFQNGGLGLGFETAKPSWVEYDTLTGQITLNRRWPLQPPLTDVQKQTFQLLVDSTGESFAYLSPNGRYIVYGGQRPSSWDATRWGVPIGIADLQSGQHIITDLPTSGSGADDYSFGVRWSGDSGTFTVKTVTGYAATYIYYVTNLNQPTFAPKLLTIAPGAPPNPDFISGIPIGTDTIPVYDVYAISFDGQKLLLDGVNYGLLWNRTDESQDRTIPMPDDFVRNMGFDSQTLNHVLIVSQKSIARYDLATSQTANIATSLDPSTATAKSWVVHAWVAPDGKHVAIMSGMQNSDTAHIRVVALTS